MSLECLSLTGPFWAELALSSVHLPSALDCVWSVVVYLTYKILSFNKIPALYLFIGSLVLVSERKIEG